MIMIIIGDYDYHINFRTCDKTFEPVWVIKTIKRTILEKIKIIERN